MSLYMYRPSECATARIHCHGNDGLWVTMMSHCRFLNCNRSASGRGMLIVREAAHVSGRRVMGKLYNFSSIFREPKTASKK